MFPRPGCPCLWKCLGAPLPLQLRSIRYRRERRLIARALSTTTAAIFMRASLISGPLAFRRIALSLSSAASRVVRAAQRLLVRPLHHSLVTHAVDRLFPDDTDFVDYVILGSRGIPSIGVPTASPQK